jgi:hypothetical protein
VYTAWDAAVLACKGYLKDRFIYDYLILRFGYPSHFAGTNNCE